MAGIFGSGKTNSTTPKKAHGIDVQTSVYGTPITLAYGQCRIGGNLLDYVNFKATAIRSSSGKGGITGGGKGGAITGFNYQAGVLLGLCEGLIVDIPSVWSSQTKTTLAKLHLSLGIGDLPQGVWSYLTAHAPLAHRIPYSAIAWVGGGPLNLGTSPALPNFNFEVQAIEWASANATTGDAQPCCVIDDLLTNPDHGLGFDPSRLGNPSVGQSIQVIPGSPFKISVGAWPVMFAYGLDVVGPNGALFKQVGSSPQAGEYTIGPGSIAAGGILPVAGVYTFNSADAGMSVTINFAQFDSWNNYRLYCMALGLWISPAYESQTQLSSMLDDIVKLTNSEVVWTSGFLAIVPRGTVNVTGNGFTYNAPMASLASLTDDDFLPNTNATGLSSSGSNDDPIIVARQRVSDQINEIKMEFLDRAQDYAPSVATATDKALLDRRNRRNSNTKTAHIFCDKPAANTSAQLLLQREYVRNLYNFTLDSRFDWADPMDIVDVTDSYQEIFGQWVRLVEITENDDGSLSCVAEEYPNGTGGAIDYGVPGGQGYNPAFDTDPGNVNPPIVFCPSVAAALAAGGSPLEVWILVSGVDTVNWGGANLHLSTDSVTYVPEGSIVGPSRMGLTTADYPVGSDPDTTDTLSVDLTESAGDLGAGTTVDADLDHTLCYVKSLGPVNTSASLSAVVSGALADTTYFVHFTYVYATGESPTEGFGGANLDVPVNNVLYVTSPPAAPGVIGWNVYVGVVFGAEQLQNALPIAIGTDWQEPNTGLIAGALAPTACTFELISYSAATLTSSFNYDLDTYVRRGQYNTPIIDHPLGADFGRLDTQLIKVPYTSGQIFSGFFAKFTSLNVYNAGEQDISTVTAYDFAITGPPPLQAPTGLVVTQSAAGAPVVIKWDAIIDPALTGYDVFTGDPSLTGPVALLNQNYGGTTDVVILLPGSYIFYVRGRDLANLTGSAVQTNFTVT